MPFLPPTTGNGKHTTYKNDDLGGWFILLLYPHYQHLLLTSSSDVAVGYAIITPIQSDCRTRL